MPVAILVVSLVALVGGLSAFLMGFSLLPTDVGMTWLKVGASLLSGGVVALAIGFATRVLGQQLAALRIPVEPVRSVSPSFEAPVAPTPEPLPEMTPETTPEIPAPASRLKGLALGGIAAATATGAALVFADKAKAEEPAPEQEPEQELARDDAAIAAPEREDDLFLDDVLPPVEAAKAEDHVPEAPAEEAASEPASDISAPPSVLTETPALPPVDFSFERELEAFGLRLTADPAPEPQTPEAAEDTAASQDEPAALPIAEPTTVVDAPEKTADEAKDETDEDAAPAVPAGLIADEDLAALEAAQPALAPIDTLEIVGAYDSGGVRFTMYSDGSVNAVGTGGERRYPSLEALRKQLDAGLPAV